jgi:pimeloyl-[acyl-carrier protein] methyl ester esterase
MADTTAILLPGLDGTGELFAPFVAAGPTGIRTIVVNYPTSEISMEVLERHARDRLTTRCIVIAESFSGPIGVRIASDARVQALVLCNSFILSPHLRGLRHFVFAPFFAATPPEFLFRFLLTGYRADPALAVKVRAAFRRLPAGVVAGRIRKVLQADEQNAVRSLHKPVLYLRGTRDNLVSERSWRTLLAVRPDAQMVKVRGPHMLLQVSPGECWQAIEAFIDRRISG